MLFGHLEISADESKLRESDTTLSRCDASGDPLQAATRFLTQTKGLKHGEFIQVTGNSGSFGTLPVFCITDASKATGESAARTVVAMRRGTFETPRRRRTRTPR